MGILTLYAGVYKGPCAVFEPAHGYEGLMAELKGLLRGF
jgi:hypothetical protein